MKVRLLFVPPGGGETDYSLYFELPALPASGDYIYIIRPGEKGAATFIVRRTWWALDYPEGSESNKATVGTLTDCYVECEFALASESTKSHKEACKAYAGVKKFGVSGY